MNLPLNIDLQQILLHLFNFIILATGLYLLLYKPVLAFMDKRTAYYKNMQDEADEKVKKAQELIEQYQTSISELEAEIRDKRMAAAQQLQAAADAQQAQARHEADAIIAAAQKQAEQERAQLLHEAQKEITALALCAAQKILLQSSGGVYDQFLDALERSSVNE